MPSVFPVPGFYLKDVPAVEHDCDHDGCVESGAFTTTKPPPIEADADTEAPEVPGPLDSPEV